MNQKHKHKDGSSVGTRVSSSGLSTVTEFLTIGSQQETSAVVVTDSSGSDSDLELVVIHAKNSTLDTCLPSLEPPSASVLEKSLTNAPRSSPIKSTIKRPRSNEDDDLSVLYESPKSLSQPEDRFQQTASTTITSVLTQPDINRLPAEASTKAAKLARAISTKVATEAGVHSPERQSYLQIFDRILHTVLCAEAHLFSDYERQILTAFSELDRHSRYLYTRLFMRKQAWVRVSSLNYGEKEVVTLSCKYLSARIQDLEPFILTEIDIDDCEKALALLLTPELKVLAKSKGIKQISGKTKEFLCSSIIKCAKQRTVTSFFRKDKDDSVKQRLNCLINEVTKITGPLVYLNPAVAELFERLHLVFFRSPVHIGDDNTMRLAILATIGQIRFPKYTIVRSSTLFASKDDLVRYKLLLEVSAEMAELAASSVKQIDDHRKGWEIYLKHREDWAKLVGSLYSNTQGGTSPISANGSDSESTSIEYWKCHFTPGWALSRIVERGAKFAATLKQYFNEEEILLSLVSQKAYRLHKRGEWYERLILLYSTHLRPKKIKGNENAEKKALLMLKRARGICIRAIQDEHVNRISLHSISRQLRALEAKLGVETGEYYQHPRICLEWQSAPERTVYGVRINNRAGRGPSLWDGNDGIPCTVEQLALWRYKDLGYKGLHSENAMATTLFSLLFWDIIFHPLPGVLDTEYQSRPLDMGSNTFYSSRKALVDRRLEDIAGGGFADIIRPNYEREFGAECVGVSWDITLDNLLTVAQYIGGKRLTAICEVLAKEYRLKSSGFPDLCMWNNDTKEVLFAEVKGPRDKLSDSQRDWIDILLTNGIAVEVCLVREGNEKRHLSHSQL
ncbi:hypothetical protein GGI26_002891 [Coemansia sp. RSA 1358]|uniref:Fanconi-associated nuclease n=1 Tax=Coemansia umbellata TaxID=1424467 RepID=A0ABQ8PDI4_9FUNG|nr:hypothetical protein EDC05_006322 [Coemansia umbellata]KAJ2622784.1 hypothetical protein GGI26_002891 [Coemansia sp. RSA 1358]